MVNSHCFVLVRFLQAVTSFVNSVVPVFDRYPKYAWVMKTLMEPERVIQVTTTLNSSSVVFALVLRETHVVLVISTMHSSACHGSTTLVTVA